MGARESALEYEYFREKLDNINPSETEFEYWVSIHNIFKDAYEIPKMLQDIPRDLASEVLSVTKELDDSQFEIILKEDAAGMAISKAEIASLKCTKILVQVLTRVHQSGAFRVAHDNMGKGRIARWSEYASSFFESKIEAEEFPFDFERYQACLMEVARFLHFVFDFNTHLQKETHYLLILQSFRKQLGPAIEKYAEKKKVSLKCNLDTVNSSISFLQGVCPLSKIIAREITNASDLNLVLVRSLGRLLISCCMTLHKNLNLDIDDTILFMKAAAEGMIILDQLEPQGCFSEKALPRIPSLLVVQTIGLYINHSNPELQELALVLLYQLKVKCKSPKDMPVVIKEILASVVLESVPSKPASQFQFS